MPVCNIGKLYEKIRLLQNLNITQNFVYRAIKGTLKFLQLMTNHELVNLALFELQQPAVIKSVKARIQRNPNRKQMKTDDIKTGLKFINKTFYSEL